MLQFVLMIIENVLCTVFVQDLAFCKCHALMHAQYTAVHSAYTLVHDVFEMQYLQKLSE